MKSFKKIHEEEIAFIQEWFNKNGPTCNAVIGMSGGKDSLICAALCAEALGPNRVIGVQMPNGEQSDIADSTAAIDFLKIKKMTVNIKDAYDGVISAMGIEPSEQTKINLAPRIRMATLYAISQTVNGRVINTSNLSESSVGYFTRWGDELGDIGPLRHLTKSNVVALGDEMGLPKELVHKAPSDGLSGKTDEDKLGVTYKEIDAYLDNDKSLSEESYKKVDALVNKNNFKKQPISAYSPNWVF